MLAVCVTTPNQLEIHACPRGPRGKFWPEAPPRTPRRDPRVSPVKKPAWHCRLQGATGFPFSPPPMDQGCCTSARSSSPAHTLPPPPRLSSRSFLPEGLPDYPCWPCSQLPGMVPQVRQKRSFPCCLPTHHPPRVRQPGLQPLPHASLANAALSAPCFHPWDLSSQSAES